MSHVKNLCDCKIKSSLHHLIILQWHLFHLVLVRIIHVIVVPLMGVQSVIIVIGSGMLLAAALLTLDSRFHKIDQTRLSLVILHDNHPIISATRFPTVHSNISHDMYNILIRSTVERRAEQTCIFELPVQQFVYIIRIES